MRGPDDHDEQVTDGSGERDAIEAVVRRYAEAWKNNDLNAIVDSYHDEVVFHYFGGSPLAGTHRGKPARLALLIQVWERDRSELIAGKDVSDFGDRVLLYRVRDGKLSECWVYDEDQRAVDEF